MTKLSACKERSSYVMFCYFWGQRTNLKVQEANKAYLVRSNGTPNFS